MAAVALIPPYDLLSYATSRPLRMILPSCLRDGAYRRWLEDTYKEPGYTILDNGMFENAHFTTTQLLELATEFKIDEVVLPDFRDDAISTLVAIREALKVAADIVPRLGKDIRFMAVVQGINLEDRMSMVERLGEFVPEGTILGFPRFLTRKSVHTRLETMQSIAARYSDYFQFHMLGMSREWPQEFRQAARQFGDQLRGMDTDAPFVWAYNRMSLRGTFTGPERPAHYFFAPFDIKFKPLIMQNIRAVDAWAEGKELDEPYLEKIS